MKRRTFLQTLASGAAATCLADGTPIVKAAEKLFPMDLAASLSGLRAGFMAPPAAAQPWVYWFVSDGNITERASLPTWRRCIEWAFAVCSTWKWTRIVRQDLCGS